jgi:head-tail adaptor
MTTGELRERVRIERRATITDDGYGNTRGAWALFLGPVAARIAPATGSEEVLADRPAGIQPAEITIRWSRVARDIQPQDRVVDVRHGRTWNILAIANTDERHGYLTISASAGGADG